MKIQHHISMPHTYIHTYIHMDKPKPICPHFFKVGGIKRGIYSTLGVFKAIQDLQTIQRLYPAPHPPMLLVLFMRHN